MSVLQTLDEDGYHRSLEDGADFYVLLVDGLNRFLQAFRTRMPAVILLLQRILPSTVIDDDDEISNAATAGYDSATAESDDECESRPDLQAVDDSSLAAVAINLDAAQTPRIVRYSRPLTDCVIELASPETQAARGDNDDVMPRCSESPAVGELQHQRDVDDRQEVLEHAAQSFYALLADTVDLAANLETSLVQPPYRNQDRRK